MREGTSCVYQCRLHSFSPGKESAEGRLRSQLVCVCEPNKNHTMTWLQQAVSGANCDLPDGAAPRVSGHDNY